MGIEDSDEITQRELRTHRHDVEDARREGVIVGLERALLWGSNRIPPDLIDTIRAEIERLKAEG